MKIIILAGGAGSRLKELTKKTPKPMLLINKKPFLEILVNQMKKNFLNCEIILSIGYKSKKIKSFFLNKKNIFFSEEMEPLGTGGAVLKSMKIIKSDFFLVLNGDTFINYDFKKLLLKAKKDKKNVILISKKKNCSRYGNVKIKGKKILYLGKGYNGEGYVDAGIYLFKKSIFKRKKIKKFSLDAFVKSKINNTNDFTFLKTKKQFIDIGIKKDYFKAKTKLKSYESSFS